MAFLSFLQNEVLGMAWLNRLTGEALSAVGIDIASQWGSTAQFFIYDVLKITVLLCVLIFGISYIQSYFPPERSKRILGRFRGLGANFVSALLGTVTPFCSCSSIPLFIGFTSARLPIGVTFSFFNFISDGGSWKSCIVDEHFRRDSCLGLRDFRTCDCSSRWHVD